MCLAPLTAKDKEGKNRCERRDERDEVRVEEIWRVRDEGLSEKIVVLAVRRTRGGGHARWGMGGR